ncbi:DUF262 domain-containing protein [Aurantimonas sp. C2-6-R+9]|uniref:DUF262 domain-containing protein n=1 Tax=unclassified Aurantimonas TaxID=2638230 RepID=UPI002E18ECB1|nr:MULTISPECIES: DUF262 domain-containing protein [unclassified Aurantimonas]MEC5293194.1 DUF262 domain-containing protein [Aurantimonas sp. C2-3-R2]MEC5383333.1 DUF262 domain-containing protein [Aurantimonas sp. C2-6-R+9]MEC5414289.1 DUF262 domain-containing protein [Aurantimonas sp. C2-4-R8]
MAEIEGLQDDDEGLDVGNMAIPAGASDKEIEKHFEFGRLRVVQEKNDIFLSHVLDFIRGSGENRVWTNLKPEYQRRLRWDNKKKSKLIESFIMNIPVPPIFLYEKTLGKFEVMDGQQRLNAISEFWAGSFELEGLKIWAALNGRTYAQLPPLVRRGLEAVSKPCQDQPPWFTRDAQTRGNRVSCHCGATIRGAFEPAAVSFETDS